MGEPLSPCPFCSRHVRASEAACPFCGGALDAGWGARPATAPEARIKGPLSRAALLFMGAAAAAGCGEAVAVYGPGPVNDDASVEAGTDAGNPVIGAPDAGVDSARDDSGGPVAIYSAAPVRETF